MEPKRDRHFFFCKTDFQRTTIIAGVFAKKQGSPCRKPIQKVWKINEKMSPKWSKNHPKTVKKSIPPKVKKSMKKGTITKVAFFGPIRGVRGDPEGILLGKKQKNCRLNPRQNASSPEAQHALGAVPARGRIFDQKQDFLGPFKYRFFDILKSAAGRSCSAERATGVWVRTLLP